MFHSTQWIFWVGPITRALLAVLLSKLIKSLEYESANSDPDFGPATPSVSPAKSMKDSPDGSAGRSAKRTWAQYFVVQAVWL